MRARHLAPVAALLAAGLVLAAPLAASADARVDPVQAPAGSATELVFTIPSESQTARTARIRIRIPSGFGRVTPRPLVGWSARVSTAGAATQVDYRAVDGGVGPGATQSFRVRVADVPSVGRALMPVTQTYSDGEVAVWRNPPLPSGGEPEAPSPVLYVNDAPPAQEEGGTAASPPAAQPAAATDPLPVTLATAALVVALGALGAAVAALLRRR